VQAAQELSHLRRLLECVRSVGAPLNSARDELSENYPSLGGGEPSGTLLLRRACLERRAQTEPEGNEQVAARDADSIPEIVAPWYDRRGESHVERSQDREMRVSRFWKPSRATAVEYLIAIALIAVVTAGSFALAPLAGHAAVALVYLLLVVIAGLKLRQGPVLFIAASGALLWDYLFNPPFLSFFPENVQDVMLFVMFFVVALAMGRLTSQLRENQIAEHGRERRTAALSRSAGTYVHAAPE
jgi:K+-sensing histidine kinase KdpD